MPVSDIVILCGMAAILLVLLLNGRVKIGSVSISRGIAQDTKSLLEHDLIARLEHIIQRGINLPIIHEKKKAVLEHFYKVKCSVFLEATKKYIASCDGKVWPDFMSMVYDCIQEYNARARLEPVVIGHCVIPGVPQEVIDAFDKFHEPHISAVVEKLKDIRDSEFHRSARAKLIAQLDTLDMGFLLTEIDLMAASNALNGKLEAKLEQLCNTSK